MDPRQRGLTRTEAVGDRSLYLAKGVLAGAAMGRTREAIVEAMYITDSKVIGMGTKLVTWEWEVQMNQSRMYPLMIVKGERPTQV